MQLQAKTAVLALLCVGFGFLSQARAESRCFDFSKVITEPLRPPVTKTESGMLPEGWTWAAVRGTVDQSIEGVLQDLKEHRSTKSSRVNKMELKDLGDKRYLLKQEAKMEVDPFPFVRVKWTETWAFAVTKGTPEKPDRVTVSYEKTEGTNHIEHLCGSYLLERKGPNQTDVFIYEEAKATDRSVKDTENGLLGNLKALGQSSKR